MRWFVPLLSDVWSVTRGSRQMFLGMHLLNLAGRVPDGFRVTATDLPPQELPVCMRKNAGAAQGGPSADASITKLQRDFKGISAPHHASGRAAEYLDVTRGM